MLNNWPLYPPTPYPPYPAYPIALLPLLLQKTKTYNNLDDVLLFYMQ